MVVVLKERTNTGAGDGYDPMPALKAVAHPIRLRLVEILSGGEKCVCDLVDLTGASQPLVSHHLAVLRKAGLLNSRQDATWAYYRVSPEGWEALRNALDAIRPSDAPAPPCPPEGSC